MNPRTYSLLAGLAILLGLALMIGGIVTEKNGAVVIGIIVAGVAAQRWQSRKK